MLDFNCGIYTITSPSGRLYIGSATNFRKRWSTHRHALRAGTHHSEALQQAFNKYGAEGLVYAKIAFVARDDLIRREQEQIDSYPREFLYNTNYIAASRAGVLHSSATRLKMSASQTGRKASQETLVKLSQAKFNVAKPSNTSGYCGVSFYRGHWSFNVCLGGKRHSRYGFASPAIAHDARVAFIAAYNTLSTDTQR